MRHPLPLRRACAVLLAASLLAACGATPGSPTPSTSGPGGSPGASPPGGTCGNAPVAGELPEWAPPTAAPEILLVPVSSQQVCGSNRFMFSFLDTKNRPIAAPDRTASVAFFNLGRDPERSVATATGTFIWAIEGSRGVYVVNVDFTEAGLWGAEFTTAAGGSSTTIRFVFDVRVEGSTPAIGDPAPASRTPTLADVGGDVALLSTDPEPVARFHETSVDAALASGDPFVLVFATPKFCTSAQCGPTLDRVKPIAAEFPDLTVIVVEPYELELRDGSLNAVRDAGGQLTPVPSVIEWGLVSEPWIFVVDGDGIVTASFEGIVSEDELRAAVEAVR